MISKRLLSQHLLELDAMRRDSDVAWVFAVPSVNVGYKQCDAVPEEFKKAGIGLCMSGGSQSK